MRAVWRDYAGAASGTPLAAFKASGFKTGGGMRSEMVGRVGPRAQCWRRRTEAPLHLLIDARACVVTSCSPSAVELLPGKAEPRPRCGWDREHHGQGVARMMQRGVPVAPGCA